MRVNVGKSVYARQNDLVTIKCWLPKGVKDARLYVWSCAKGFPLSPHVPLNLIEMPSEDNKPRMLKPFSVRLHETRVSHIFEFYSDENLIYQVRQEKDVASEPSASVKVRRLGKVRLAIRDWFNNHLAILKRVKDVNQTSTSL